MLDNYFQQLATNTLLLTPNRRLATVLHDHYIAFQKKQGATCWPKPTILSINAWLEYLWNNYLATTTSPTPYLLNTVQAQAFWESIISEDHTHNLLQVAESARSAKTAWELMHQYQANIFDEAFLLSEDYALCQKWFNIYGELCHKKNYIDGATLPDFLHNIILQQAIILPEKIFLYGFTEVIPQHHRLIETTEVEEIPLTYLLQREREIPPCPPFSKGGVVPSISQGGVASSVPPFEKGGLGGISSANTSRTVFSNPDDEIIAMARFAKAKQQAEPGATIGCVVLDLTQRRERVLQLFTEVFFPERPYDIDAAHYPFNISAGKSLSSYAIIATALLIIGLTEKTLLREQLSHLLLSPYIGEAESEHAKRALLDAELRRKNIHRLKLNNLSGDCPLLFKRIGELKQLLDNKARTFREWSQHFNNMLAIMGWPGEISLSSEEYQVAQAWLNALNDFSTLDKTFPSVTRKEAWQHLQEIINAHIFQPQSPKTNIQVLGMLEAAAMPFDYMWVGGLNDISWPPQPAPHPLIPKQLQRQFNMPHATAERELHFCSLLLTQFQHTCHHLVFSYAESDGKLHYASSPLLQEFSYVSENELITDHYTLPTAKVFHSRLNETFQDHNAPPIPLEEKIYGGADALKQQAACPFRAFSTYRLQAYGLDSSTQGFNPKDRGIIIHEIMQNLWKEIKSQENLLSFDSDKLQEIINHHIDNAIKNNSSSFHEYTNYLKLEKIRLNKIINEWLNLEKSRPPFIVSTNEEKAVIELNNRQLTVRIDRIDTLSNGKKLIIDYKSGKNNTTQKWYGERPDEPQLPLYTLLDSENTIGISFAQLAAGNIRYKGISETDLNITGIEPETETWPSNLIQWRNTLEKLANDFCEGNAAVDPKRPATNCKNCEIIPLCRIYEVSDPFVDEAASHEDE